MSQRNVLIVYGTSYGQTARIAGHMADLLTAAGQGAIVLNVASLPERVPVESFSGVIVGASVRFGRHQRSVAGFVRAHRDQLNAMPSAFFSVSGSAGSNDATDRTTAQHVMREFLRSTGWSPPLATTVGGAMAYTKYSPLVRWMIRRISAARGGPTDTTRDHELTDWEQVARFVEEFRGVLAARTPSGRAERPPFTVAAMPEPNVVP